VFASVFVLALAAPPPATPVPTAQVSAAPTAAATATPPALTEIGHVKARGRASNLVGTVPAASVGTIDQEQIAARPILRPGELLEQIPGLVITQHSGEGKANQYYLRGFQLDHGTDLDATVMGVPVNLPTHAHGQGYSDINWLIPELVSFVEFKKGPYFADQGDFSTAGSYNLSYRNVIPTLASAGIGAYGYDRLLVAASPRVGAGNLLYALEAYHDNGSFVKPDEYHKLNGVLRWSRSTANSDFNVTAAAYGGTFDSTDQIPQRLVADGLLSPYGYIDPSDGGATSRTALSTQWQHTDAHGSTQLSAYAFSYGLRLYSDFTYYLDDATDYYNVTRNPITCNSIYTTCTPSATHLTTYTSYCPANASPAGASSAPRSVVPAPFHFACGDQREQLDQRFVSGFNLSRSFVTPNTETVLGAGVRSDNIATVGLFLTNDRQPYVDGTLSDDHVVERDASVWAQTTLHASQKLRLIAGLRGDLYDFKVLANVAPNSGAVAAGMLNPKFAAAYELSAHQELYADFGDSFHSNDGRGLTQTVDPQTHATIAADGQAVQRVTPLVRAAGEELGYRYSGSKLTTTVALWQLNLNSELVFQGDDGTTAPGPPTMRKGIEVANYFRPRPNLTIDADFATSTARFLADPNHVGTGVPESLNTVVATGATVDGPLYSASLRMRYFGPRTLDTQGDAVSAPATVFNAQVTRRLSGGNRIALDIFNILNAQVDDVEYYYNSWLPQDARLPSNTSPLVNPALGGAGVADYHLHPAAKRTIRLTFSTKL